MTVSNSLVFSEDLHLPLRDIATKALAGGASAESVRIWITRGLRLPSGEIIHLPAVRVGHKWMVRVSDLEQFLQKQQRRAATPQAERPQ